MGQTIRRITGEKLKIFPSACFVTLILGGRPSSGRGQWRRLEIWEWRKPEAVMACGGGGNV